MVFNYPLLRAIKGLITEGIDSMKRKLWTFIISIILCTYCFSGCNYREINEMPMVSGIAIDKEGDIYHITVAIIVPTSDIGESGDTEQVFVEAWGKSIFDAIRDMILKDGKKIFFGQLNFVLISYNLAKENIEEAIDLFMRDDEFREDVWILVGDEKNTAKDLLVTGLSNQYFPFYVPNTLKNADQVSKYDPVILSEFVDKQSHKGVNNFLPRIYMDENLGEDRIIISGGYVIKGNKIVGMLDGPETQMYRLLIGKEKGGVYVIEYEQESAKTQVSIEVINSKSKLTVMKNEQGEFEAKADIAITGIISEIMDNTVKVIDYDKIEEFKEAAAKQLEKRAIKTVKKVQTQFGSDIFGFGTKVYRKYPNDFLEVEEEWDSIFSAMPIAINVEIVIEGSALTKQPLYKGD